MEYNTTANIGAGNITLQGNGNDLSLGSVNFSGSTAVVVNRYITITGNLTTSGTALTLTGNGGILFSDGASVTATTNGIINFTNDVTLNGAATVNAGNGAINFNYDVIGSGQILTLQNNTAATGTVTFSGNVDLGGLQTFAQNYAVIMNGTSNIFANALTFNNTGGVTLGNNPTATFIFNNGLTSTASITTLNAEVTANGGSLAFGNVVLGGDSSISTIGGGINTLGTISGAHNLSLTSATGSTLGGAVNIANLTLNGGGTDTINTNSITTSGNQIYSNAINLAQDAAFTATNVTANSITGNTHALTITNTGTSSVISGIISDLSSFTKAGSGSLTLSGANTYANTMNINGGILNLAHNNSLGTSTATVANGATLLLTGAGGFNIANNINLNNSTLAQNTTNSTNTFSGNINGSGTNTIDVASNDLILAGAISGSSVTFNKIGSGKLILTNNNSFSGNMNVNAGELGLQSNTALGNSTANIGNNATLSLIGTNLAITNNIALNAGSKLVDNNLNGNNTLSGNIAVTGATEIKVEQNNNSTLALTGVISGLGVNLNKTGLGMLVLSGNNTFTGNTNINEGTLNIQSNNALGANSATASVGNGAALLLSNNAALNIQNNLSFANNSTLMEYSANGNNQISGAITFDNNATVNISANNINNDRLTLSGVITGNNVTLNKNGIGTLILSGTNSFSGTSNVNAGKLQITNSSALGSSTVVVAGSGKTFELAGAGMTVVNNITLNDGAALLDSNTNATNTISGAIVLNGTNTVSAVNQLNLSGVISGSGVTFDKSGIGTVTLSGTNTYSGNTNISSGTLSITNKAKALGDSTVNATASSTFNIAGNLDTNLTNAIQLNSATLTASGTNTLTGNILLAGTNNFTPSGTLTLANTAVVSGSGSLNMNGTGTLIVAGTNTYNGITTLTSGTLQANNANAFSTGSLNLNGGTLQASTALTLANANFTVGGTTIIGGSNNITLPVGILNAGTTLNINNSGITNFNSGVSGNGAVNINGGTTRFGGNNSSYNGALTLNSGALQINNTNANPLGIGALNLNGGTLSALVTASPITNVFTVDGNATIGGSNNITFNSAGLSTLNTGSTLAINNTGTTTFAGSFKGAGNININAGTTIISGDNTDATAATSYSGTSTVSGNSSKLSVTNNEALGNSSVVATNNGTFNIDNAIITSSNSITLNTGNLTTDGIALLNGPITLTTNSANNFITVNAGSVFTLNQNINGAGDLTLQGAGVMIMNGEIGHITALRNFTQNVTITYGGTEIYTTGDQIFDTPITLINHALFSSDIGNITITANATIDGNHPLFITSGGTVTVNGVIGGNVAVDHFETNGSGMVNLGANITAQGSSLIFNSAVTLLNDITLTDLGPTGIHFNNAVNGNGFNLNLFASNGSVNIPGSLNNFNNISITGINGITGNINANTLILNGLNGSNLTGSIGGNSTPSAALLVQLDGTAVGDFFFNGCLVGGPCGITPPPTPGTIIPELPSSVMVTMTASSYLEQELILSCDNEKNKNGKTSCSISKKINTNLISITPDILKTLNKNSDLIIQQNPNNKFSITIGSN